MYNTLIMILLALSSASCNGHLPKKGENSNIVAKPENSHEDTLSVLTLDGDQYKDKVFKIIQLYSFEKDRNFIEVKENDSTLSIIRIPTGLEAKNLSVNDIVKTGTGFKILVDWGGGNYFYKRDFHFSFVNNQFLFVRLETSMYYLEDDKEEKKVIEIDPPILLHEFELMDYIVNE